MGGLNGIAIRGTLVANPTVLDSIRRLLNDHDAPYREVHHVPTRTSTEAASARGESIKIGGKAIVAKVGAEFKLFVCSAERRIRSRVICKHFGAARFRFATRDELHELTGLVPGCIPPFGRPILPLDLYLDESILENERIAFNAGSLTDSIIMSRERYVEIANPLDRFSFSKQTE
jgi:Ala-tRNA(Pro) deacylase